MKLILTIELDNIDSSIEPNLEGLNAEWRRILHEEGFPQKDIYVSSSVIQQRHD